MATDPARITTPERTAEDADAALRPKTPRRVHRPAGGARESAGVRQCRQEPRRGARPCAAPRPAGARQDDARRDPRARDGRRLPRHLRPGDRQVGRPRRAADQPRGRRRPVHRRDPPPQSGGRGSALSGDGGPRARPDDRRRAVGALGADRPAALHPDRRDHAAGAADDAAARPLRHSGPAQFLHGRGAGAGRPPRRAAARRRRSTDDGAHEIARRSRGTPRIAGRLLRRVRDFAHAVGRRHDRRRGRRHGACRGWRSTRSASTRWTGAI